MSGREQEAQQAIERAEAMVDSRELINRIASQTAPGKPNHDLRETLRDVPEVVERFEEDTNNWFEIIDVRTYRQGIIGIPCRWRWTIKRWVTNDMDQWLMDNGWEDIAHLRADSEEHKPNELEARYIKDFGDYTVFCNFYVEITDDVFESLQTGEPIKAAKDMRERNERIEELRQKRR